MEWLSGNWVWFLLAGGMFGMHYFGHGRHGAGGGCCGGHAHGHRNDSPKADAVTPPLSGERDAN